ncbi:hypothetical protein [Amycolatopsis silviterrae]|uniref:Lipoprotein n=1 Tax=Amycolatopsis silviterrae TaxID=1656914 RepID=A0ABW5H6Z5_9PSEU
MIVAGAVLLLLLLLSGCSSVQDTVNDACSDVKDVVNAVPKFGDPTHAGVTVPALTKQIEAAQKAQQAFERADVGFRGSWERMIKALQESVTAWKGWDNKSRPGASDMYFMLRLGDAKKGVDEAKGALNAAAGKSGFTECGERIQWKY